MGEHTPSEMHGPAATGAATPPHLNVITSAAEWRALRQGAHDEAEAALRDIVVRCIARELRAAAADIEALADPVDPDTDRIPAPAVVSYLRRRAGRFSLDES